MSEPHHSRKARMGVLVALGAWVLLELIAWPLAPPRMDAAAAAAAAAEQARSTETAMRGSDLLGWELVPGTSRAFGVPRPTTINQLGTRNPEFGSKQPGTLRMITLGDSSVYGVMVEDAEVFSAVAGRDLQHALGQRVEVINGGVPGYSSEQARRLFTHRLAALQPDIVVIATLWSDSQPGPTPDAMRFGDEGSPAQTILRWSNAYRLLEGLLLASQPVAQVSWSLTEGYEGRRVPIQAYRNNLDTLAQLAKAAGAVPVFLILPCDRDLGPTDLEAPRPAYRAEMRAAAARQNGVLVETPAHFIGQSPDHFFDDVHPTAKGHAIIGKLLGQGIGSQLQPTSR